MTRPLSELILSRAAFDARPLTDAAAEAGKHFILGEQTIENSREEMHEYGFYSGARYERDKIAPLITKLAAVCEAAKAISIELQSHSCQMGEMIHSEEPLNEALSALREFLEEQK